MSLIIPTLLAVSTEYDLAQGIYETRTTKRDFYFFFFVFRLEISSNVFITKEKYIMYHPRLTKLRFTLGARLVELPTLLTTLRKFVIRDINAAVPEMADIF